MARVSPRDELMVEASAELLAKMENAYQEGVRIAEHEARFPPYCY
jgi:hypothetical protein